jgi:hypothetical protein
MNPTSRLAADISADLADRNDHVIAAEGLIPRCVLCDGSGLDGDDYCDYCRYHHGRATCECGEPALRYEHYQTEVIGDGGAIVMGACRSPLCLRCCKQACGLVGPLTGYEADPDAPVAVPAEPGRTVRIENLSMQEMVFGEREVA